MKIRYLTAVLATLLICTLTSSAQTQWIGVTSVNWATASNWTNGVPTATTDVVIGDGSFTGPFQPAISVSATAKSITIGGSVPGELTVGSMLTIKENLIIQPNGSLIHGATTLSITKDWINNGTYSAISSSSTVIFCGYWTDCIRQPVYHF